MHSLCKVLGRPQILDLEPFSSRNLRVAALSLGLQFANRPCPCGRDLAADRYQLLIPCLQQVPPGFATSHLLEQAVALLEDPLQTRQRAGVARLDLDQHLVQKAPPELRSGLDQAEVVRPEKGDPEM